MTVTFAERKHFRNDPRRMNRRKIALSFGAIMSATFLINKFSTHKESTPPYESISRSKRRRAVVRKVNELAICWGKLDWGWQSARGTAYYRIESAKQRPCMQYCSSIHRQVLWEQEGRLRNKNSFLQRLTTLVWTRRVHQCILGILPIIHSLASARWIKKSFHRSELCALLQA